MQGGGDLRAKFKDECLKQEIFYSLKEAQTVIGMRLGQIAMGRGTAAEAQLMVTEKVLALAEASVTLATGGSPHKVVKAYRKKVQANSRRLRR